MKLKIKNFITKDRTRKDVEIEIQEMNPADYYNIETALRMGHIDFSTYAIKLIKDCIAFPAEAREKDYWDMHPKALDMVLGKIRGLCGEGLDSVVEIEEI